jgi:outer membrane murein-binding lipoprotein Lpp
MTCMLRFAFCVVPLLLLSGCTNSQKKAEERSAAIAQEQVALVKRLADEVAKNPNSVDVAGIVEEFMNMPLDPKAFPAETAEILDIYQKHIKGKLTGDVAMQMESAISRLKK